MHNTSLQELSIFIPLSATKNEQIRTFFNVVLQKNHFTELKLDFKLDQSYSDEADYDIIDMKQASLFYEQVLPLVTNMLELHTQPSDYSKYGAVCFLNMNHHLTGWNQYNSCRQFTSIPHFSTLRYSIQNSYRILIKHSKIDWLTQNSKPLPIYNRIWLVYIFILAFTKTTLKITQINVEHTI